MNPKVLFERLVFKFFYFNYLKRQNKILKLSDFGIPLAI